MILVNLKLEYTRHYKEIKHEGTLRVNGHFEAYTRIDILLNKAVDLCWDPLTVKFTGVFKCICSKAVVSEPWPNFVNRFCWNYHNCLLFEIRITRTQGQNREYSSVYKNDECKRDRPLFEQRPSMALFSWSTWLVEKFTWAVFVPVLCDVTLLPLFVVTVVGKIESGHKTGRIMFPCTFCKEFLGHSFKRLLRHIKFIHSHEPNVSITYSDCGRSFRKFASWYKLYNEANLHTPNHSM